MRHMRLVQRAGSAVIAAAIASAANGQVTVADNFDLAWDYQWNMGWSVSGPDSENLFGIEQMMGFVPDSSGVVSDVWVAISYAASDPGIDIVTLRLVMDSDGQPGPILEEWVIDEIENWYQWNEPIHLHASGNSYLHAGQLYWLWASAGDETWTMWAFNTTMDTGPITRRIEGEYWTPVFWDTRSTFRVDLLIEPELPECPEDVNGDRTVNVLDLLAVIAAWGSAFGPADVNGDGVVDVLDLLAVIGAWGDCPGDPVGACCLWDGTCIDATEYDCIVMGPGLWFAGESCATITCPEQPVGACCFWPGGECQDLTVYDCYSLGGVWQGAETTCASLQCPAQADPDFYVTAPYTSPMRSTCGAGNDCALATSEDHIYEITINEEGYWHFSLCDSLYDTIIAVGTEACLDDVGFNDDACGGALQSEVVAHVLPGVYYVDIEGYNGECGQYILDVFLGSWPTGACCVDAVCVATTTESECDVLGGTWYQNESCPAFACPVQCPQATILVKVFTDDYPDETTWDIVEQGTGIVVGSAGPYPTPGTLYVHQVCVNYDSCFDFTIYDAYGDGICCSYGNGYYEVYYEDELVGTGGQFGVSETVPDIGDNCAGPLGACCIWPDCVATVVESECDAMGGDWYAGESCPGFVCPEPCNAGNGPADGDNGTRPGEGWSNLGIMEDAIFDAATAVSMIGSEFIDLTTPVGSPSAITQQEFRIYDLAQGDGTIEGLDPLTATPLVTVILEVGVNATKTICGGPFFEGDVECWDGWFDEITLPPGHYGVFWRFPGVGAVDYYFATGGEAPNASSPSHAYIWGLDGAGDPISAGAYRHCSFCLR